MVWIARRATVKTTGTSTIGLEFRGYADLLCIHGAIATNDEKRIDVERHRTTLMRL